MPKISVIVPVYGVEEYLNECVDSILAQTFTDFEVILVDDGSPDLCGQICDDYSQLDKRVTVIHKENGGLSSARNAGLDIAKGSYITFIDSDDAVSIHYLKQLYQSLIQYDADVTVCDFEVFQKTLEYKRQAVTGKIKHMRGRDAVLSLYSTKSKRFPIYAWGKLYKKKLFEGLRFPVGKIHEDQRVVPIAIYKSNSVVWLNEPLYSYRNRIESITRSEFSLRRFDDIEALDYCINFFKSISDIGVMNAAGTKRMELLAYYTLLARKAGVYQRVPKKYKMSRIQAIYRLRRLLSFELYEYRMVQMYPKCVCTEVYIRQILRKIGLTVKNLVIH